MESLFRELRKGTAIRLLESLANWRLVKVSFWNDCIFVLSITGLSKASTTIITSNDNDYKKIKIDRP